MIEYITNIFIFPLIGVVLGIFVYHFYHKIDDKNYLTTRDYLKCAVLSYIVCFAILFIQKNMVPSSLSSLTSNNPLTMSSPTGSKGMEITDVSNIDLDCDNIFTTGHPSF